MALNPLKLDKNRAYLKQIDQQAYQHGWHRLTHRQRRAEVTLGNRGTYVGLACAAVAAVLVGMLAFNPLGIGTPRASEAESPASTAPSTHSTAATTTSANDVTTSAGKGTAAYGAPAVWASEDPRTAQIVANMTTQQKVDQLFIVSPEAVVGTSSTITAAGSTTENALALDPVGGIIYSSANLEEASQIKSMLSNSQTYSNEAVGLPLFLAVNEEGGSVSTVGGHVEGITNVGDAASLTSANDAKNTYQSVGNYLLGLGFNLDLAPVADVSTSSASSPRTFGSDPNQVASLVSAAVEGLNASGILCSPKHFPGIGGVSVDAEGKAMTSNATLAEMESSTLPPFQAAMAQGVPFVMVGHLSTPAVSSGNGSTPASFNSAIVTDLLRNQLGYQGLIITDALNTDAITSSYSNNQVGVLALQAGCDVILCPKDFDDAKMGVIEAVRSGKISEDRLNQSVARVVNTKLTMNNKLTQAGFTTAAGKVRQ